jgi:hypothetical protein
MLFCLFIVHTRKKVYFIYSAGDKKWLVLVKLDIRDGVIYIWENYNLPLQTISRFASSLTNYQRLDSGSQNYQKVSKMSILSKYAYNTPNTHFFKIKNKI